jgi:hypothetical protein
MGSRKSHISYLPVSAVALCMMVGIAVMITGEPASTKPIGVADDWSHRHLVFSNPGTYDQVKNDSAAYSRWLKIQYDTRYILQQMKRNRATAGGYSPETPIPVRPRIPMRPIRPLRPLHLREDWSESLNSTTASVGADNYPAKYSFSTSNPTTANCAGGATPDFVVYNTGVAGSSSQASIIAYDNLYSGLCTGTVPQAYWAYNTGGTISTSVVLSLDGTQVAFIHTPTSGASSLVLLKWATSTTETAASPLTLTAVANSSYRTCTAPCMTTIGFGNGFSDPISSPFYDYADDIIYVGDDGSTSGTAIGDTAYLHKFAGVFKGTLPGEAAGHTATGTIAASTVTLSVGSFSSGDVGSTITGAGIPNGTTITAVTSASTATMSNSATAGTGIALTLTSAWPVNAGTGPITSAVFDGVSQKVYVTNDTSTLVEVTPAGASTASATLVGPGGEAGAAPDVQEGPIVDPTAETVYIFEEGATNNFIVEYKTNFASGAASTATVAVGTGVAGGQLYSGTFDNAYYASANGTGNLYVCGDTAGNATLYQIPITSGTMSGTANTGPTLTTANYPCSPLNEVYNTALAGGPYDWIYLGVRGSGPALPSGCAGGACVMGVTVTSWQPSTSYTKRQLIVNSNFNIEVVTTAGTSGSSQPTWPSAGTIGVATTDGGVTWTSQGPFSFTGFTDNNAYSLNTVIVDSNNNLERVTTGGTSGGSAPMWSSTFGAPTTSGTVTFTNQGPSGIVGSPYAGGTSGLVVDNIGSAAGSSNIYFSTLGSETCVTSGGTAGCAVQAAQNGP